jgi:hypothetical protein
MQHAGRQAVFPAPAVLPASAGSAGWLMQLVAVRHGYCDLLQGVGGVCKGCSAASRQLVGPVAAS